MNLPRPNITRPTQEIQREQSCFDAGYAKGRADLLAELNAGVEVPEKVPEHPSDDHSEGYMEGFNEALTQLLDYGAAQRLLGAREEREECAKACRDLSEKVMQADSQPKHILQNIAQGCDECEQAILREVKHD